MCSSLMATSLLLRIVLLLTTFDLADDKFDFAPVQSHDMRSSRRKKILVQGDKPQRLSVHFLLWAEGAILGVKNKKMKTKIGLLLTLFFNLSNNSTDFIAFSGYNLAKLSPKILINY